MTGQTIAHYRVTAKLGQGGMGAVYRATDSKLDREVAIKVLPESFAQDKERLARFEREAKALAALNHSNIAGIFGIEQAGDSQALILELVEGEDLSERLKRGPLPVEEALEVCKQIAEALEAAHGKGIIHRDLKPGNIKLLSDGRVKVLDFGLGGRIRHGEPGDLAARVSQRHRRLVGPGWRNHRRGACSFGRTLARCVSLCPDGAGCQIFAKYLAAGEERRPSSPRGRRNTAQARAKRARVQISADEENVRNDKVSDGSRSADEVDFVS